MKLTGWGQFPIHDATIVAPRDVLTLISGIKSGKAIARGNGRAYGDSAISFKNTVHMKHFNRMVEFDEKSGRLVAESGVLLADIISSFLPKGWFPAVTPGTKFVTLGGMIAADVHGKNHHRDGGIGNFVDWIEVIDQEGNIQRCSRQENEELFNWTIGGMGLTGIILRTAIRLRKVETAWIKQVSLPAKNLDQAFELLEKSDDSTYSVAWIDCQSIGDKLGRSLVMLGEHAELSDLKEKMKSAPLDAGKKRKKAIPFNLPSQLLNRHTVRAFNALYYINGKRMSGNRLVDWDTYFYPLDAISDWNRIYGRRGFAQFQCVLPQNAALKGLQALLTTITASGCGSFLAVLKKLGPEGNGISFPMLGHTLALDFPISKKSLELMTELDKITLNHGGRFYLAKDSRMTSETLKKSDSRVNQFAELREKQRLRDGFQSAQSERLKI